MIKVKNIRSTASDDDGFRVFIEPAWPRKVSREKTVLNAWMRDLAPSPELYNQFSLNLIAWEDFIARYHRELEMNRDFFPDLQAHGKNGGLTLIHGFPDEGRNPAVALRILLEQDAGAATGVTK